jgi:MerR family transcriptional regulator, copper efflux regulator
MNIGAVAKQTGLNAKTIRYYESIELVDLPPRRENGYREYSERNVQQLWFLRHARQFGFSIEECRELLSLWANPNRRSAEVHSLVTEKVKYIEQHIGELRQMKKVLTGLLDECSGDDSPDCAIIDKLASELEK